MAASIGTAWIQIKPTLKGVSKEIERELSGTTAQSNKANKSVEFLGQGFATLGKIGLGVAAAGVAAVSVAIGKNLGGAIKRVDTLVAFPKVLQALGATSGEAGAATDKLAEKLRGLPTGLAEGAAGVQRLVTAGLSVPKATDAFLGLNNALIASGAGSQQVESTMLQLSQALSRGRIEGQEWNAIAANMPVLLGALQESTGKSSEELREMFRLNPQALMDKIIELNEVGVDGMGNLENAAREATGGIGTAFANMDNAIQRGIENIVKAIGGGDLEAGQKKISDFIADVGTKIGEALTKAGDAIAGFIEFLNRNEGAFNAFKGAITGIAIAIGIAMAGAAVAFIIANAAFFAFIAIAALVGAAVVAVGGFIRDNWEGVKNWFSDMWNSIKDAASSAWEGIKSVFSGAIEWIKSNWPTILAVLTGPFGLAALFIANNFDKIKAIASAAWNGIKSFFGGAATWFGNIFNQVSSKVVGVFNGIVSFVRGIPGTIVSVFSGIGSAIGNSIKEAINNLLNLPLTLPSVSIAGKTIGGQTLIPRLAEGGIVTSATLALVGEGKEPEAVIPLSKLSRMINNPDSVGQSGSNTNSVHIENVVIASDYDASRLLNTLGIQQDLYNKGVVSNG